MNQTPYIKHLLLLFFCFQIGLSYSQLYVSGQDPASIKWNQINTENFQIIFPEGFEKQAQYFANVLDQTYELATKSLSASPRKISVLIHNRSVISNGITAWAPRRIDIYATPPQDTYAENWLKQLAIHEFRHVVQMERINTGLTKVLGIILGEQAAGAVTGAYLPSWFLEGDAVATETALGQSGRGRLPSFEMPLKAQLLEKGIYSYEKAVHGSYQDYTPSAYKLGYQMVAYGRSKYGTKLWDNTLESVARNPLFITPFSAGIKKTTSLSKREFYKQSLEFIEEKWSTINKGINTTDYHPVTKIPQHFTNYLNPVFLSESYTIAEKTSMDDVRKIVRIDKSGNEQVLLTPGPSYSESLSLGGNLLCWSEIEPDHRWSNRNYSVIKLFNIETQVLANWTNKSRYFSPQINQDGTKIATVEVSHDNKYHLVVLDVLNGKEIYRYEPRDGAFLMHPVWSADGNEIVMTVLNEKGKNIRILDVENGATDDILAFSFTEISRPRLIGSRVFFTGAYSGIDNLYAFDRGSKEIKQITSVKYGVGNYLINPQKNEIIFSNYTVNGFELALQALNQQHEISLSDIQINRFSFVEDLVAQEHGIVEVDKEKMKIYEVKKYFKASGLFNFHSWTPLSIDMNTYETKPGIMFMSQNLLSTAITTLGYEWDMDERVGKYYANFTYRGWYPVIDLNVEYGQQRDVYRYRDTLDQLQEIRFTFHEFETSIGISQPLNFSKNKFVSRLTPFARFSHNYRKVDKDYPLEFAEPSNQNLEYGVSVYHYLRSSLRDLYPKWGIVGIMKFIHTPFTSLKKSNMFTLESTVYIPGFMKHHGFKFYAAMQLRKVGDYTPSNVVSFLRGMSNPGLHNLFRFSADYKFPLFYPDWDLNSLMYLKRVTMGLFYDYGYGKAPDFRKQYYSLGTEVQAQMHILSFIAPVNIGFRAVYVPDLNDYVFDVFLNIDFSVLY